MASEDNEKTTLLSKDTRPNYLLQSTIIRQRHRRLRQFQCCICAILLCTIVVTLVFAVSYGIGQEDFPDQSDSNTSFPNNTFVLLSLNWPRDDIKSKIICFDDNEDDWQSAWEAGEKALKQREEIERNMPSLDLNNPSYAHQKLFFFSNKTRSLSRTSYLKESVYKYLYRKSTQTKFCPKDPVQNDSTDLCSEFSKYRSFDGSCNNLKHPLEYGVAFISFRRALPPDYADGISKPRTGINGTDLPAARRISLIVHRPVYKNDDKFTILLAVWGQFLDHDITATALTQRNGGKPIACCLNNSYSECFSVQIDKDDPYYKKYNTTCMEFIRSAGISSQGSQARQQLNQVSSFIDGSVVYGANINATKQLREFRKGKLKMFLTPDNRTLLPISTDPNDGCNRVEQMKLGRYCFMTGDQRANENLYLTSMHLIWARHHNSLATQLGTINPHWNDEQIFQEARRILIAQMQHITYNEFLKVLFGKTLMKKLKLYPRKKGYYKEYDNKIDPSIANNFATAAFRFGHTLIPSLVKIMSNSNSKFESVELHKILLNPFTLYQPHGLDKSLLGAMNTSIEASDSHFNMELKNRLFEKNQTIFPCGLDLVSLNIQRGRDHGLPGYIYWREYCGLKRPRNFRQLIGDIDNESLDKIRQIYRDVSDIDLYTGAISEKPLEGGILGPTFTCLVLDQFIRLKAGDRMWYENPVLPHAFTLEQLDEIRLTSLAHIICDNSDNVTSIRRYIMQHVGEGNEYVPCKEVPRPDLTKWKDANLPHVHIADNSISVKPANITLS